MDGDLTWKKVLPLWWLLVMNPCIIELASGWLTSKFDSHPGAASLIT
jgi:hypothetical protein